MGDYYKGHKFKMISSNSSGDWVCELCGLYVNGGPHDGGGYYPGRGQSFDPCSGHKPDPRQDLPRSTPFPSLRASYEKLPENAKDDMFAKLLKLLMWRGTNTNPLRAMGMDVLAEEIADIFANHTGEIPEYT